jgi:hypothetical protein
VSAKNPLILLLAKTPRMRAQKNPQPKRSRVFRNLSEGLGGVIADSLHRAALFGFLAAGFFLRACGLLKNVAIAAVLVALEIIRSRLAAQITVNALVVYIILSRHVLGIFVCYISHKIYL